MGSFVLLAKINAVFHIAEKVAYGVVGVFGFFVAKRYIADYRNSLEDDKMKGGD